MGVAFAKDVLRASAGEYLFAKEREMTPNEEVELEKINRALDANLVEAYDTVVNDFVAKVNMILPGVIRAASRAEKVAWGPAQINADFQRIADSMRDDKLDMYADVQDAVSSYVMKVVKAMYEAKSARAGTQA